MDLCVVVGRLLLTGEPLADPKPSAPGPAGRPGSRALDLRSPRGLSRQLILGGGTQSPQAHVDAPSQSLVELHTQQSNRQVQDEP